MIYYCIKSGYSKTVLGLLASLIMMFACKPDYSGGIGSRVFVIERATQSIAVIDYRKQVLVKKIPVKGDLRHASMVFDADLKYGYVSVRDGHLIRINLETLTEDGVLQTSQSSIGLAISSDGKTIAVSEYKPGGVTLVDVDAWKIIGKIPAQVTFNGKQIQSRVTGMVDGPNNSFLCALMDANEIWYLKPVDQKATIDNENIFYNYSITKIKTPIERPFDALIAPNYNYYITGHFESRRASLLYLDKEPLKAQAIDLQSDSALWSAPPKMPHMESWAVANDHIFVPIPGEKKLAMIDTQSMRTTRIITTPGFPVYAVVRPDEKEIWVTFSGEDNDGLILILDTKTGKFLHQIKAGKRIYHIAITPRGDRVLVSSNLSNEFIIYNTYNYQELKKIQLDSPSGIFGVWRAFQTGL